MNLLGDNEYIEEYKGFEYIFKNGNIPIIYSLKGVKECKNDRFNKWWHLQTSLRVKEGENDLFNRWWRLRTSFRHSFLLRLHCSLLIFG